MNITDLLHLAIDSMLKNPIVWLLAVVAVVGFFCWLFSSGKEEEEGEFDPSYVFTKVMLYSGNGEPASELRDVMEIEYSDEGTVFARTFAGGKVRIFTLSPTDVLVCEGKQGQIDEYATPVRMRIFVQGKAVFEERIKVEDVSEVDRFEIQGQRQDGTLFWIFLGGGATAIIEEV